MEKMDKGKYKAEYDTQINTLAAGDKFVTRILGLAFLSDARLVLIDCKNNCLKIFKPEGYDEVIRHNLDDEPRGVTSTFVEDEIVVTFAHKHEVQRFKIGQDNKVLPQKTFKVKEKPFTISFSKNTFAIENGEGKDGSVIITDLEGNQLEKISGARRHFGMFTGNTIRLAHDHEVKCIYVVDITKDHINCVDYTGNIKWTVEMKGPRDIVVQESVLFVASKTDNTVYQLEKKDGKINTLLTSLDNIIQPRFIACQHVKKKLAVEVGGNVVNLYMFNNN